MSDPATTRRWNARLALAAWAAAIAWASLMREPPGASVVGAFKGADVAAHFIAYGVLAVLASHASPARTPGGRAADALMASILYGLMLEGIQPFVGRSLEVADLLSNAVGALAGALAGTAWVQRSAG